MTPIRSLTGNIVHKYHHFNKDVEDLHISLKGILHPNICIDPNLSKFYGPKVILPKNQICVSETFLNYLWAFIYFSFTYQEKSNDLLLANPSSVYLPMTTPELITAKRFLDYSKSLVINGFSPWPSNLISPKFSGTPSNDVEDFALKTNGIFSTVTTLLFMHEIGHVYLNHGEEAKKKSALKSKMSIDRQYIPNDEELSSIIIAETEADNFALDLILKSYDDELLSLNNAYGVTCCFSSLLFCIKTLKGISQIYHPNLHDRLLRAIQRIDDLQIKERGYFAHFAGQCLMLLLDSNNISLDSYDAGTDEFGYLLRVLEKVDEQL